MDHYKHLGVNKESRMADIKSAYRRLSKQYHPDITKDDGSKFRDLTTSYDWLLKNHKEPIPRRVKKDSVQEKDPPQPSPEKVRYRKFFRKRKDLQHLSNKVFRVVNLSEHNTNDLWVPDYFEDEGGFIILLHNGTEIHIEIKPNTKFGSLLTLEIEGKEYPCTVSLYKFMNVDRKKGIG